MWYNVAQGVHQMKQTLLEIVQRVLESVDGQMVESITDTREAMQVANIVKECYEHLLYTRDIKSKSNLVQLHSMSDVTHPTLFEINDDIEQISLFKYYDRPNDRYVDVTWLDPEDFVNMTLNRNPTKENVINIKDEESGVRYNIYNDRCPQYFTSFDDSHIVCDAYNASDSHTLMEEFTVVYGYKQPEFKLEDTFVPDLAPQHFSLLLSEAKVYAGYELNKVIDTLERDRAMKQKVTADKHAPRVLGQDGDTWKTRRHYGRTL